MFFVSLLNVRFCDCKVPQKTTFHSKGIIFIFSARLVQPSGVPYYNSCGICHFCFAPKQCQGLFRLKHSPSHYAYHALVLDLNTLPTVTKRLLVPSMVQSESLHWKMRCALLEQSKLRDSFPCHQVINPFIAYKKKRKKKNMMTLLTSSRLILLQRVFLKTWCGFHIHFQPCHQVLQYPHHLAPVAIPDVNIVQFDIKAAFLYGFLIEEIFMI